MKPSKQMFLEAIAKIERFSPAPRILSQAMRLLKDPDADLDQITRIIRSDAALMADILRGANSAYYGLGEKVSSLERAIQKIGFVECIRLLKISVSHTLAAKSLSCYGIEGEAFWAESLFTGIFVEKVAKATRCVDADTANTTGLLRWVGRLAINQCLNDFGIGLFWNGSMPLHDWEMENVGFLQAEAGGHLLRAWRFPDEVALAIEFQESPERAPAPNAMLDLMHFAGSVLPEGIDVRFASELAGVEEPRLVETAFTSKHGITAQQLKTWLVETRERFNEVQGKLYGAKAEAKA
jgi:HD-like signal output (HDOD) protein